MTFDEWISTVDAAETLAGCATGRDRLRASYDAGREVGRVEGAGGAVVSFPPITDKMLQPTPRAKPPLIDPEPAYDAPEDDLELSAADLPEGA